MPPGRVSELGRAGALRACGDLPSLQRPPGNGASDTRHREGVRGGPGGGRRQHPVPATAGRADTPPAGGAQRPWWAARTRAPGARGRVQDADREGNRGWEGEEEAGGAGQEEDPLTACPRCRPRVRARPRDPGTAEPPPAGDRPPRARAHLARRRRWSARRWPCRPRTSAASPDPRWPWWRQLGRTRSPARRRRCRWSRPAPCAPPRAV